MTNHKDMCYDLIVAGGGTAGFASAISAARKSMKVLLIEKNSFLGGTATGSLVTPMMKNSLNSGENLTGGLVFEVIEQLNSTKDCASFKNISPGWFNPEIMKCVLDDFCVENNVSVLFETSIVSAETENNGVKPIVKSIKCLNKAGMQEFWSKYFIDATGDADLAAFAGVPFESDEHQTMSLRFIMSNVNIDAFIQWLIDIDPSSEADSVDFHDFETVLFTAAHTWDNLGWKLRPFFALAIREGVIESEDAAYFQLFAIPGQKNSVAFNCPRISSTQPLDPLNPNDISYAYMQGRRQLRRLASFCKKYLGGFEEAYISQIAPNLGIRDSRRIKGLYTLTEKDILGAKKFPNAAARSNYPVDVHSREKGGNRLEHLPAGEYYEIPLESMIPVNSEGIAFENLLVAGRCISATFSAQASLRIQPNCWSMGEFAGNYFGKIN